MFKPPYYQSIVTYAPIKNVKPEILSQGAASIACWPGTGLQHGTMSGEYAQPSNFNRREGALLLPVGKSLEFVLFWENPQDITYSHWILGLFIRACCRKEQSPFPTVRADRLYEFPQPCTSSQAYTGGASGKPRPTKRTGIFPFVRSHSKSRSFLGARKIRGILTPVTSVTGSE